MRLPAVSKFRIVSLALVCLIPWIAGCEPKVRSPISGLSVTEPQLLAELNREKEKARLSDEREAAEAKAKVARAESNARLEAQKLEATSTITMAELRARLEETTGTAVREYQAASAERSVRLAGLEEETATARADIERQRQAVAGLWAIAKPFASSIPGGGAAVGAIDIMLGLSTVGAGAMAFRGNAKAKREEEASRSIVNAIDVLRTDPAVSAAMKARKADMLNQLTDHAVKLIASERIT